MFKLNISDTFTWPVEVLIPVDGGKFDKQTFDAVFKRRTKDELAELQGRDGMTDDLFVREVLTGWAGITDGGEDVPFSDTALAQVLAVPGVSGAIVTAYYSAVAGLKKKG